LSERRYDIFFIGMFTLMFIVSQTIDIISGLGFVGHPGAPGITKESIKTYKWPPQFLLEACVDYCTEHDPVFCYNPMWMKIMAGVSTFIYAPFYMIAIPSFIKGWEFIREPALMYGWGMFYTVSVILAEEYGGDVPSPNFTGALIANFLWWAFPVMVIIRMRGKHPFTTKSKQKIN